MDSKEKDNNIITIELANALDDYVTASGEDTVILSFDDSNTPAAGQSIDSINLGSGIDHITLAPTMSSSGGVYTIGNLGTSNVSWNWNNTLSDSNALLSNHDNSGQLELRGDKADIKINGRSIMDVLDGIEQRLGLLKCREDLESEWNELRELGDRYRELQRQIEEKTRMWDALKAMPKINPEDL